MKPKFKRHFRIYLINNHPAYIVDEEGNEYIFHRVTESQTSGGKKNWEIVPNPIKGYKCDCYIVKHEEHKKKNKFSSFKLETKEGVDTQYPWIKRAK
mgnify:CR=1 FL=1